MQTGQQVGRNLMLRNFPRNISQQFGHQARRRFASNSSSKCQLPRRSRCASKPQTTLRSSSTFSTPLRSSPLGRTTRQTKQRQQYRASSDKSASRSSESSSPTVVESTNSNAPESQSLSLSQRMRKLSREYGWSALGVYLGLSALDFPFCFAAVRLLGVERIGHYEHVIVSSMWSIISLPFPEGTFGSPSHGESKGDGASTAQVIAVPAEDKTGRGQTAEPGQPMEWSWGVEEAEKANNSGATIWTQLALAYAIHKSFIFLRVPLTAAVTPKVVKVLRGWGWDIGKRRPKVTQ